MAAPVLKPMQGSAGNGVYGRKVLAVVLAAGCARRFGRPKQLACLDGVSLVRRAADAALASCAGETCVVVGAYADVVSRELDGMPVLVAENEAWQQGQSSTLHCAVRTAQVQGREGILFLPVDMPFVDARHLNALLEVSAGNEFRVAASLGEDGAMAPCVLPSAYFPELLALQGDKGAVSLIRRLEGEGKVALVPFRDSCMAFDVDTPDDLEEAGQIARGDMKL